MNINKVLSQFTKEELQKLAGAQSAADISRIAKSFDAHTRVCGGGGELNDEESEEIFKVLLPIRGKEPLNEEDLDLVSGGFTPKSFYAEIKKGKSHI